MSLGMQEYGVALRLADHADAERACGFRGQRERQDEEEEAERTGHGGKRGAAHGFARRNLVTAPAGRL
jgi:hypothetical protein